MFLPIGTTAQRPANTVGMIRWNTDTSTLEINNGASWAASGAGSVTSVAITSDSTTSSALTVVSGSPITTAGTIHLALGTELVGLAGLASTGLVVHTGAGTYVERTITGTAGNISISNGNGVLGAPTINLATVSQGASGSFVKIGLDTFGRVVNNVAVSQSDITGALTYTPVNKAGDTMSGNLAMGGNSITGLNTTQSSDPTSASSKGYVDAVVQGLSGKPSATSATTTTLPAYTYANGTLGVGATLTASATGTLTIDTHLVALNDVILVKNETGGSAPYNGLYTCTTAGAIGVAYVLTRHVDMDATGEFAGGFVFINAIPGSANGSTGWLCTTVGNITVGTTNVTFTQFSGAGTYAGTPNQITLTGSVFSLSTTIITPGSFTASPLNANVVLSPTGTGLVTINPATLGSIDNMTIGATTPTTGKFTTVQSTVTTGTAPFVVASTTPVANLSIGGNAATATSSTTATNAVNSAITNDAATAVAVYPAWVTANTGNLPLKTTSAALSFVPSTGVLSATSFAGAGTGLTGTAAALSIGGTATTATNAVNTGITAVATNATFYPTFVSATTGNLPIDVSTGLTFNPSTNTLSLTSLTASGQITSTVTTGTAPFVVASTTQVANLNAATAGTATNAVNTGITAVATNATFYPAFVSATTGNLPIDVSTGLTFNPSTNTLSLTALSASGQITSTVTTGTAPFVVASTTQVANLNAATAGTATNATNVGVTAVSTNATFYPTFVSASTGNLPIDVSTGLTFNPSTNTLSLTALTASGQITSTVTTGTAPFVVASITQVANLNVSQLVGATWAAPLAIGSTTPAAGTFTTLTTNTAVNITNGNFATLGDARQSTYVLRNVLASASFTGTIVTTNLTTTAVSGTITVGQVVAGASVSAGTTILSQTSGTPGGAGVYVVSISQSVGPIAMTTTQVELFLDGVTATSRLVMQNNSVYTFQALISGRRTDATGGGAGYSISGVFRKDATAASTTLIGAVTKSILGETNTPWDATVVADTVNGSIKILVTGETTKTIRWVAAITTSEVVN